MTSITMPDIGVVAIIRLRSHEPPEALAEALVRGGVTSMEVTVPTPGALSAVERWREVFGEQIRVGAGTVRSAEDAAAAVGAGAQFLVTPGLYLPVLERADEDRIPVYCGAATPTEIDAAWQHGAAAVKVFPARELGGPGYIRAVRDPLADVPLVPTGGVTAADAAAYRAAGCVGLGIGSSLVSETLVAEQDWTALQTRAAALVRAWEAEDEA